MKTHWKKRLLSLTLALSMVLPMLPIGVFAAVSEGTSFTNITLTPGSDGKFTVKANWAGGDNSTIVYGIAVLPNYLFDGQSGDTPFDTLVSTTGQLGDMAPGAHASEKPFAGYSSAGPIWYGSSSGAFSNGDPITMSFADFTCEKGESGTVLTADALTSYLTSGGRNYTTSIASTGPYPYRVVFYTTTGPTYNSKEFKVGGITDPAELTASVSAIDMRNKGNSTTFTLTNAAKVGDHERYDATIASVTYDDYSGEGESWGGTHGSTNGSYSISPTGSIAANGSTSVTLNWTSNNATRGGLLTIVYYTTNDTTSTSTSPTETITIPVYTSTTPVSSEPIIININLSSTATDTGETNISYKDDQGDAPEKIYLIDIDGYNVFAEKSESVHNFDDSKFGITLNSDLGTVGVDDEDNLTFTSSSPTVDNGTPLTNFKLIDVSVLDTDLADGVYPGDVKIGYLTALSEDGEASLLTTKVYIVISRTKTYPTLTRTSGDYNKGSHSDVTLSYDAKDWDKPSKVTLNGTDITSALTLPTTKTGTITIDKDNTTLAALAAGTYDIVVTFTSDTMDPATTTKKVQLKVVDATTYTVSVTTSDGNNSKGKVWTPSHTASDDLYTDSITVNDDSSTTVSAEAKPGYEIDKWTVTVSGSTTDVGGAPSSTSPDHIHADRAYTVYFKPVVVSFDANSAQYPGASSTKGSENLSAGSWTLTSGQLGSTGVTAPTNYSFDGWYTSAIGGTKVDTSTEFKTATKLYAHYKLNNAIQITVNLDNTTNMDAKTSLEVKKQSDSSTVIGNGDWNIHTGGSGVYGYNTSLLDAGIYDIYLDGIKAGSFTLANNGDSTSQTVNYWTVKAVPDPYGKSNTVQVTSSDTNVTAGTASDADTGSSVVVPNNTDLNTITFTATETTGYRFKEWKDNSNATISSAGSTYTPVSSAVNGKLTFTAVFDATYLIGLEVDPTPAASQANFATINYTLHNASTAVTSTVDKDNNASGISGLEVRHGSSITLTSSADTANGWRFSKWTRTPSGGGSAAAFTNTSGHTADGAYIYTAHFVQNTPKVTLTLDGAKLDGLTTVYLINTTDGTKYQLTDSSDGIYTKAGVKNGTYDICIGGDSTTHKTGQQITVNNNNPNAALAYVSDKFRVVFDHASSDLGTHDAGTISTLPAISASLPANTSYLTKAGNTATVASAATTISTTDTVAVLDSASGTVATYTKPTVTYNVDAWSAGGSNPGEEYTLGWSGATAGSYTTTGGGTATSPGAADVTATLKQKTYQLTINRYAGDLQAPLTVTKNGKTWTFDSPAAGTSNKMVPKGDYTVNPTPASEVSIIGYNTSANTTTRATTAEHAITDTLSVATTTTISVVTQAATYEVEFLDDYTTRGTFVDATARTYQDRSGTPTKNLIYGYSKQGDAVKIRVKNKGNSTLTNLTLVKTATGSYASDFTITYTGNKSTTGVTIGLNANDQLLDSTAITLEPGAWVEFQIDIETGMAAKTDPGWVMTLTPTPGSGQHVLTTDSNKKYDLTVPVAKSKITTATVGTAGAFIAIPTTPSHTMASTAQGVAATADNGQADGAVLSNTSVGVAWADIASPKVDVTGTTPTAGHAYTATVVLNTKDDNYIFDIGTPANFGMFTANNGTTPGVNQTADKAWVTATLSDDDEILTLVYQTAPIEDTDYSVTLTPYNLDSGNNQEFNTMTAQVSGLDVGNGVTATVYYVLIEKGTEPTGWTGMSSADRAKAIVGSALSKTADGAAGRLPSGGWKYAEGNSYSSSGSDYKVTFKNLNPNKEYTVYAATQMILAGKSATDTWAATGATVYKTDDAKTYHKITVRTSTGNVSDGYVSGSSTDPSRTYGGTTTGSYFAALADGKSMTIVATATGSNAFQTWSTPGANDGTIGDNGTVALQTSSQTYTVGSADEVTITATFKVSSYGFSLSESSATFYDVFGNSDLDKITTAVNGTGDKTKTITVKNTGTMDIILVISRDSGNSSDNSDNAFYTASGAGSRSGASTTEPAVLEFTVTADGDTNETGSSFANGAYVRLKKDGEATFVVTPKAGMSVNASNWHTAYKIVAFKPQFVTSLAAEAAGVDDATKTANKIATTGSALTSTGAQAKTYTANLVVDKATITTAAANPILSPVYTSGLSTTMASRTSGIAYTATDAYSNNALGTGSGFTWKPSGDTNVQPGKAYTIEVTIKPDLNHKFDINATTNPTAKYSLNIDSNLIDADLATPANSKVKATLDADGNLVLTYTFPPTAPEITGLTLEGTWFDKVHVTPTISYDTATSITAQGYTLTTLYLVAKKSESKSFTQADFTTYATGVVTGAAAAEVDITKDYTGATLSPYVQYEAFAITKLSKAGEPDVWSVVKKSTTATAGDDYTFHKVTVMVDPNVAGRVDKPGVGDGKSNPMGVKHGQDLDIEAWTYTDPTGYNWTFFDTDNPTTTGDEGHAVATLGKLDAKANQGTPNYTYTSKYYTTPAGNDATVGSITIKITAKPDPPKVIGIVLDPNSALLTKTDYYAVTNDGTPKADNRDGNSNISNTAIGHAAGYDAIFDSAVSGGTDGKVRFWLELSNGKWWNPALGNNESATATFDPGAGNSASAIVWNDSDCSLVHGISYKLATPMTANHLFTNVGSTTNGTDYDGQKIYLRYNYNGVNYVAGDPLGTLKVKELQATRIEPMTPDVSTTVSVGQTLAGAGISAKNAKVTFNFKDGALSNTVEDFTYNATKTNGNKTYYFKLGTGTAAPSADIDATTPLTLSMLDGNHTLYICYTDINNHEVYYPLGVLSAGGGGGAAIRVINQDNSNKDTEYGDQLKAEVSGVVDPSTAQYRWQRADNGTNWTDIEDGGGNKITTQTYTAGKDDVGKFIRVVLTNVDGQPMSGDSVNSDNTAYGDLDATNAAYTDSDDHIYVERRTITFDVIAKDKNWDDTSKRTAQYTTDDFIVSNPATGDTVTIVLEDTQNDVNSGIEYSGKAVGSTLTMPAPTKRQADVNDTNNGNLGNYTLAVSGNGDVNCYRVATTQAALTPRGTILQGVITPIIVKNANLAPTYKGTPGTFDVDSLEASKYEVDTGATNGYNGNKGLWKYWDGSAWALVNGDGTPPTTFAAETRYQVTLQVKLKSGFTDAKFAAGAGGYAEDKDTSDNTHKEWAASVKVADDRESAVLTVEFPATDPDRSPTDATFTTDHITVTYGDLIPWRDLSLDVPLADGTTAHTDAAHLSGLGLTLIYQDKDGWHKATGNDYANWDVASNATARLNLEVYLDSDLTTAGLTVATATGTDIKDSSATAKAATTATPAHYVEVTKRQLTVTPTWVVTKNSDNTPSTQHAKYYDASNNALSTAFTNVDGAVTGKIEFYTADYVNVATHWDIAGNQVKVKDSGFTAAFADANAGDNKTITVTGATLEGTSAKCYTLVVNTTTGDIKPLPVKVDLKTPSVLKDSPLPVIVASELKKLDGNALPGGQVVTVSVPAKYDQTATVVAANDTDPDSTLASPTGHNNVTLDTPHVTISNPNYVVDASGWPANDKINGSVTAYTTNIIQHVVLNLAEPRTGDLITGATDRITDTETTAGAHVDPNTSMDPVTPTIKWYKDSVAVSNEVNSGTFQSGHVYIAQITGVKAKTGYSLADNVDFVINSSARIPISTTKTRPGDAAELPTNVTSIDVSAKQAGDSYDITVTFAKQGSKTVDPVVVLADLKPEYGKTIEAPTLPTGTRAYKEAAGGLHWQVADTLTGTYSDITGTFQDGKFYQIVATVTMKGNGEDGVQWKDEFDITKDTTFHVGTLGDVQIPQTAAAFTDATTSAGVPVQVMFEPNPTTVTNGAYGDDTTYTLTVRFKNAVKDNTDKTIVKVAASVVQPVIGKMPSNVATLLLAQNKTGTDFKTQVETSNVVWTGTMDGEGKFKEGETYTADFDIQVKTASITAGYGFLAEAPDYVDFLINSILDGGNWINGAGTATANGITVTTTKTDDNKYHVKVEFPAAISPTEPQEAPTVWGTTTKEPDSTVAFTEAAVTKMDGQPWLLNVAGPVTDSGITYNTGWQHKNGANWENTTGTNFARGETYKATLIVEMDSTNYPGYYFDNTSATNHTEGYINDNDAGKTTVTFIRGTSTDPTKPQYMVLEREFTVDLETVKVHVTSTAPEAGGNVPPVGIPGGAHYTIDNAKSGWYTDTAGTNPVNNGEFANGITYYMIATVKPGDGYTFPETTDKSGYIWDNEGRQAQSVVKNADGTYTVRFAYTVGGGSTGKTAIEVPGNALRPTRGQPLSNGWTSENFTVEDFQWTAGGTPVAVGTNAAASTTYTATIKVKPKDGVTVDGGAKKYFNNNELDAANWSYDDVNDIYTLTYTFPATEATPPSGGGTPSGPSGTITVTKEPPIVYYKLRDMGVTNDLTAEKMANEGDSPKAVPKVTPLDGLKFLGWSETEPVDGTTPTLVDPTTFSITADKVFYAVYDKNTVKPEEFDHNHYVIGFPDGTFGPEAYITRAQVATIVARACLIGFEDSGNYGNPGNYIDTSSHWAYSAISFCAMHSVMSGYHEDDGTITFRPEQYISRQELANVVARLAGLRSNQGMPFTDVDGAYPWALDSIYTVYSNGWMKGYQEDDGTYTFRPANYITRAETVTVFNAFLHRGVDAEGLSTLKAYTHIGVASHNTGNGYDEYMIWPDVVGHWAYYEILEAGNDHNFHWQNETTQEPPEKWDQAYIDKKWRYTDDINDGANNVGHGAMQAVTFVVKFNGRIVDSVVRLVPEGTAPMPAVVPGVVANSGWRFVGWSITDPDTAGINLVNPTSMVINGPEYFYAIFELVPVESQPTESFQPSESPAPAESAQPSESPAPAESTQPSESPAPTESAQPSESPTPTETTQPSESPAPTESAQPSPTPTAPVQVNVTYVIKSEGRVVDSVTKQVDQGSAQAEDDVPNARANEGWKFLGWSMSDPDEGNYQLVEPSSVTVEEDTTFYAVFEKVEEPQTEKNPRRAYISGFEDGTFRPDDPLNRSAAAKLLADLKGGYDPNRTYDTSAFTDLDDHWARNIIGYCVQEGLMSGYQEDDGTWTFRADNGITRQELACAMCKLTGETLQNQGLPFADASDVAEWALDGVYTAYTKGWMTGYEDGLFHPEMIITRAAAVKLLNNYLGRQADPDAIRSSTGYTTWSDVPTSHWAYYEIIEASNDWDL